MFIKMKLSTWNFIRSQLKEGFSPVDLAYEYHLDEKVVQQIFEDLNVIPPIYPDEIDDEPTSLPIIEQPAAIKEKIRCFHPEMIFDELDSGATPAEIEAAYDLANPIDENGRPIPTMLTITHYVNNFNKRKKIEAENLIQSNYSKWITVEQLQKWIHPEDWDDIYRTIMGKTIFFPARYALYDKIKQQLDNKMPIQNIARLCKLSRQQVYNIKNTLQHPGEGTFWKLVKRIQDLFDCEYYKYSEDLMLRFDGKHIYIPNTFKTLKVWEDWIEIDNKQLPWKDDDYTNNYRNANLRRKTLARHREILDLHFQQGLTPEQIYNQLRYDAHDDETTTDIRLKGTRRKLLTYSMTTINRILLLYKRLNETKYFPTKYVPGRGKHLHQKLGTRHYNSPALERKYNP
jgi:hypothetical protein